MPFVIQSGSKQYTVTPGQKFVVDRLKNDLGEVIELPLIYSYGTTKGATTVQAKIILHQKGKKIRVVKYKNKNNYHKQSGYRHYETILEILGGNVEAAEAVEAVETTVKETKAKPAKAVKVEKPAKEVAVIETEVEKVEAVTEVKEVKATKKKAVSNSEDFKKIEGIGPKIEEILKAAGINTFAELAAASEETLKEILAGAGPRYSIHNPTTWSEQSALARDEKWDELKTLQDELNGGKAA